MKKGDVVTVSDSSFSMSINKLELDRPGDLRGLDFKLIAIGYKVPTSDFSEPNDAIIKNCETGEVIFIASRNLRSKKQYCSYCGQRLENCKIEH